MLLIDIGNSRVKWAMLEAAQCVRQGVLRTAELPLLQQIFSNLQQPHKILVSNVAGAEAARLLVAACATWTCPLEFISARQQQCGVRNAYDQPSKLGSDRWAALIAAWHQVRAACLVVNCGTATTIDALSSQGEFIGGLIMPGLDMMRRSLAAGTAQLGRGEAIDHEIVIAENGTPRGCWQKFPRNTADAMTSGAIQATMGAICRQYSLLAIPGAHCVLSGGATDSLQPHFDLGCGSHAKVDRMPLLRVDNLVLLGLQIIGEKG